MNQNSPQLLSQMIDLDELASIGIDIVAKIEKQLSENFNNIRQLNIQLNHFQNEVGNLSVKNTSLEAVRMIFLENRKNDVSKISELTELTKTLQAKIEELTNINQARNTDIEKNLKESHQKIERLEEEIKILEVEHEKVLTISHQEIFCLNQKLESNQKEKSMMIEKFKEAHVKTTKLSTENAIDSLQTISKLQANNAKLKLVKSEDVFALQEQRLNFSIKEEINNNEHNHIFQTSIPYDIGLELVENNDSYVQEDKPEVKYVIRNAVVVIQTMNQSEVEKWTSVTSCEQDFKKERGTLDQSKDEISNKSKKSSTPTSQPSVVTRSKKRKI